MSFFRVPVWYLKGRSEYTKQAFDKARKEFNPDDLNVDMSNKTVLITGANSGIGLAAAIGISKLGANIVLLCRNQQKAEAVLPQLSGSNHEVFQVDMGDLQSIRTFLSSFGDRTVDVLINNAGCMIGELKLTAQGVDSNFATNVLGPYLLTSSLIPNLGKSADPRVINVSSGGMLTQALNVDLQLTPYDGTKMYAQNKRQLVEMTDVFAKKYPTIHFFSMHPGWADTEAVQQSMPDFYKQHKDILRSAEEGADTIVWAACAKRAKDLGSGSFLQERKSVSKHMTWAFTTASPAQVDRLMSVLTELSSK